ncbi:unnamed protein product [Brachionus calyciflorus]|uniref:HAT C-terminal dimerisation domain-containing protein n=1 Tax=Brachionus calyciflorus TaxID=104777 RepID=A0A814CL19_9BILA|nr:unnamed protein product [Brachionus calyciflorus]
MMDFNHLKFLHINCQSINPSTKKIQIEKIALNHEIDIIRRIEFQTKNSLKCEIIVLSDILINYEEIVGVELELENSQKLAIFSYYSSPDSTLNTQFFEYISNEFSNFILLGDLNAKINYETNMIKSTNGLEVQADQLVSNINEAIEVSKNKFSVAQTTNQVLTIPEDLIKLINDNKIVENPNEIAETFAEYLSETFTNEIDNNLENNQQFSKPSFIIFDYISSEEIIDAITKLNQKAATGIDGISNKALNNVPFNALKFIHKIFYSSLKMGHIPIKWKKAKIILIHKKEKPPDLASCYRPISLLSFFYIIQSQILADESTDSNQRYCLQVLCKDLDSFNKKPPVLLDTIYLDETNHRTVSQAIIIRRLRYKTFLSDVKADNVIIPPEAVITRWNTWFKALLYHVKYWSFLVTFVADECRIYSETESMSELLELLKDESVKSDAIFVSENCENFMILQFSTEWLLYSDIVKETNFETVFNIDEFWISNRKTLPQLFEIAEWLLYFPTNSADCERAISSYNNILSDQRNRILKDNKSILNFILFNGKRFESKLNDNEVLEENNSCIELSDTE